VDVYTDHPELLLKDMDRLITSEALYLLIGSLRGYSELLGKFGKVSINQQTIGLNSRG
jgi:hypothetical protein